MSQIRNILLYLVVVTVSSYLVVEYLRLLKPAQARSVQAACKGLRGSPDNPMLGDLRKPVQALDFSLKDQTGKIVSLSDYKGQIVLVNFWASWCGVCRSEKPSLEALEDQFGEEVKVLAIASDRDWAPVNRAIFGFDLLTAAEVLEQPKLFGVRTPENLAGSGQQPVVTRIDKSRPAAKGGLRWLDRISSANGVAISSVEDMQNALRTATTTLKLTVERMTDSGIVTKTVTLKQGHGLHVLIDPPDGDDNLGKIAKAYGIKAVPESFVIGKDGTIQHYFINKRNWDGAIARTCMQSIVDED